MRVDKQNPKRSHASKKAARAPKSDILSPLRSLACSCQTCSSRKNRILVSGVRNVVSGVIGALKNTKSFRLAMWTIRFPWGNWDSTTEVEIEICAARPNSISDLTLFQRKHGSVTTRSLQHGLGRIRPEGTARSRHASFRSPFQVLFSAQAQVG